MPTGAIGEIYVGGRAPAHGYLERPDLTDRRFLPDPMTPGGRVYRTGDLGRHLPDGRIEFLGRSDEQVKIRGYRVEPGEVEAAVKAVPGVLDAVLAAESNSATSAANLTAYYVSSVEQQVAPSALRAALRAGLPAYLVPTLLVPIPEIPLTPSGKADRAALRRRHDRSDAGEPSARLPRGATEERVAEIWKEILQLTHADLDDDFFTVGGDSLLAVRMVLALREQLEARLPMNAVFLTPTIPGLAGAVDGLGGDAATPLPSTEARLPADIVLADEVVRVAADPEHVLLTGATGFLGAFMLHELVGQTRARVHCLVRGSDQAHAEARLRASLESYGLWNARVAESTTVVLGDLGRPRLGLSVAAFDELARTVDAVYHVGASVNLAQSYAQSRAANVLGTIEVLRLAATHRTVPLHHVSTVGVFAGEEIRGRTVGADQPLPPLDRLVHGYTQSKWVAEKLTEEARRRGLPVSVYRPTRIAGDSSTGVCQTGDFLWTLLRGCVEERLAPELGDTAFDLVPVDYTSRAIVALSRIPEAASRPFHIAGERPVRFTALVELLRSHGFDVTDVPVDEWLRRLGANPANPAFPLLGIMAADEADEDAEGSARFDAAATAEALSGLGISCPPMGRDLLLRYVEYFVHSGALPAPARGQAVPYAGALLTN